MYKKVKNILENAFFVTTPPNSKKNAFKVWKIDIFAIFPNFYLEDLSKNQWIRKWKWHFSLKWSWKWKIPNSRSPLQLTHCAMYSHWPSLAPTVHTCICHMHHMQMSIFQLGVKKSIVFFMLFGVQNPTLVCFFGVKVLAENGAGVTKMTNITATICFFSPLSKQAFKCWTSTTTVCANLLHRDGFLRLSMTGSFFFKASRCTPLTYNGLSIYQPWAITFLLWLWPSQYPYVYLMASLQM